MDVGDCALPVIEHGDVISNIYGNAGSGSHGQEIHYKCQQGYVNGSDVPRCDNGTWTAEALCKPGKADFIGLLRSDTCDSSLTLDLRIHFSPLLHKKWFTLSFIRSF